MFKLPKSLLNSERTASSLIGVRNRSSQSCLHCDFFTRSLAFQVTSLHSSCRPFLNIRYPHLPWPTHYSNYTNGLGARLSREQQNHEILVAGLRRDCVLVSSNEFTRGRSEPGSKAAKAFDYLGPGKDSFLSKIFTHFYFFSFYIYQLPTALFIATLDYSLRK